MSGWGVSGREKGAEEGGREAAKKVRLSKVGKDGRGRQVARG